MKLMPREHGLTVIWITSLGLSAILADSFSLTGIFLFLLAIPLISVYDPFLISMRQWKLGRTVLFNALNANIAFFQKILILLFITTVTVGILLTFIPLFALVFPGIPLVFLLLFMKWLPERNLLSRSVSILFISGQFVLFNSAFTGHIASGEITDYVFLSLINIIIVVSVRSKVDLIIGKDQKGLTPKISAFSLAIISAPILFAATGWDQTDFAVLLSVAVLSAISYHVIPMKSIRNVGVLSTVWLAAATGALLIINFG